MNSNQLLVHARRLQSLAQAGLAYATNQYDVERFQEIRTISATLLQELTDEPFEKILRVFASDGGYQTPKTDVRAVVFRGDDEILLVKEKIDNDKWSLPGGWADVGDSPFETAVKEVREETGLAVEAVRLLALFDILKHAHPKQPWHAYKAFIRCEVIGGELIQETSETSGARWFRSEELPGLELSLNRVTPAQLETMFQFALAPDLPTLCD